jgi:hypothetical protein
MTLERWSDAKIQCTTDALGEALRDGCGVMAGIFEDDETEERFLAVYQYLTKRWIKNHATDYSIELSFLIDGFGEPDAVYVKDAEQHFIQEKPVTIDGRKCTLLCGIHYQYAATPREEWYIGINVERPDAIVFLDTDIFECFVWGEIKRITEEMMVLYPDMVAAVDEATAKRDAVL